MLASQSAVFASSVWVLGFTPRCSKGKTPRDSVPTVSNWGIEGTDLRNEASDVGRASTNHLDWCVDARESVESGVGQKLGSILLFLHDENFPSFQLSISIWFWFPAFSWHTGIPQAQKVPISRAPSHLLVQLGRIFPKITLMPKLMPFWLVCLWSFGLVSWSSP